MNRKSILRQIGRMARSVELFDKNEDGTIHVIHEANKPISGRTAGRILNNQNLRDLLLTATGIIIMVDDVKDVDAAGEIKYRKYDKNKKYVISTWRNSGAEGLMYAEIQELGHHAFEHTKANGEVVDQ